MACAVVAVAATAPGGAWIPQGPGGKRWCPLHETTKHSGDECREIQKIKESKKQRLDGVASSRDGKRKAVQEGDVELEEEGLGFQKPSKSLRVLCGRTDPDTSSDSDTNPRHKGIGVMYGGSWDITFRTCRTISRNGSHGCTSSQMDGDPNLFRRI